MSNATALADVGDGRYRDPRTGLVVVKAPTGPLYRVFQRKYSALNPPIPRGERARWSRWDIPEHVTVYGADRDVTAVVEALAYAKPAALHLPRIFADLASDTDPVGKEWAALGHMERGQVARGWRTARDLTAIRLHGSQAGWFIDIGHADTVAALRREAAAWSPDPALVRDPMQVDISLLTGGRRQVTTAVACWLRTRVLADGTQPAGMRYSSRHGQNLHCWAIWIPLAGETQQTGIPALVGRIITAEQPTELGEGTPALLAAAGLLGLRVH